MRYRYSNSLLIGTGVLALLAACSRSPDAGQTSRTALPAGASGSLQSSGDLECPVAPSKQAGGTLGETSRQVDSLGQQLGSGGENGISSAVAQLRSRHPTASEGDIVNYLITAYCPTIKARSGMSLGDKRQAVRTFATQARKFASHV